MINSMEQCIRQLTEQAQSTQSAPKTPVHIVVSLFTSAPMTSTPLKKREDFVLHYIYRGEVCQIVDGEEFYQGQDTLLLTAPGMTCSTWREHEEDIAFSIALSREAVETLFAHMLEDTPLLSRFLIGGLYGRVSQPLLLQNSPKAEALLQQIVAESCQVTMLTQQMLAALVLQCFIQLARTTDAAPSPRYNDKLFRILSYINTHCATVTFAKLAEHFHYSQGYLARLLKQKTGHTFTENLQHQKLVKAKLLLSHSDIPVSQVALAVGYADLGHFYRLFKKKYGLSPADFRKTLDTATTYLQS